MLEKEFYLSTVRQEAEKIITQAREGLLKKNKAYQNKSGVHVSDERSDLVIDSVVKLAGLLYDKNNPRSGVTELQIKKTERSLKSLVQGMVRETVGQSANPGLVNTEASPIYESLLEKVQATGKEFGR